MSERPILFSGSMVRALLDGRKTQTRRIVKVPDTGPFGVWQPTTLGGHGVVAPFPAMTNRRTGRSVGCPYGAPGDKLWVRETWDFRPWAEADSPRNVRIAYGAGGDQRDAVAPDGWNPTLYGSARWRPSIHMPRWASRLTLDVTGVRVERVQDIIAADAIAEGFGGQEDAHEPCARDKFLATFYDLNKRAPRTENPWVWVIEFRKPEARDAE